MVNQFFFQSLVNFDANDEAREKYGYPYEYLKPESVLVLGAGGGNDVATANRFNVPRVDAVEIDPRIAEFGLSLHPSRPYTDPDVRVHVDDARSFLAKSADRYDMIVMGTLDSHALLSARTTVRLDNFVYTQESLESVREHLTDKGVAVLMFSVPTPWLRDKLVKSVQKVFGEEEVIVATGTSYLFNLMIIAGHGVSDLIEQNPTTFSPAPPISSALVPDRGISTDDWPYLYLKEPGVSAYYLQAIGILLALSLVALFFLLRARASQFLSYESGVFLLLGAGFLLLEAKSITTLSLVFGSTWIVNSFVFGSILLLVLAANTFVSRFAVPPAMLYLATVMALIANYLTPVSVFLALPFWTGAVLASLLVALPIGFASAIFSTHLKTVSDIRLMYGLNLIGAVCGGFLEYTSMLTGLNALYLVAVALYVLAYMFQSRMH